MRPLVWLFLPAIVWLSHKPLLAQQAPLTDIAVGATHSCFLDNTGAVECASEGFIPGLTAPASLVPLTDIAAGDAHTCGITVDGAIVCWGMNDFGQLDAPTSLVEFVHISSGSNSSCAIDALGVATCWSLNANGQNDVPNAVETLIDIDIGRNHVCGLRMSGNIDCWGAEDLDQLNAPTIDGGFTAVDVGTDISCGLTSVGAIQCWGGRSTQRVPDDGPYTDIAVAGDRFAGNMVCGLSAAGGVECEFNTQRMAPVRIENIRSQIPRGDRFTSIYASASRMQGCAIDNDGMAACWGDAQTPTASPGSDSPIATDLAVAVYSTTTVELSWQQPLGSRSIDLAGFTILRNGEPIAITTNGNSYLDEGLTPGVYEYAVIAVYVNGSESMPTSGVTVDTTGGSGNPGTPDTDNPTGYTPPVRPYEPTGLRAELYSENTLELFWDRVEASPIEQFEVRGYEIRRNGQYIAFTNGISYLDQTVSVDNQYHYTVIPVSRVNGRILGVGELRVTTGDVSVCQ